MPVLTWEFSKKLITDDGHTATTILGRSHKENFGPASWGPASWGPQSLRCAGVGAAWRWQGSGHQSIDQRALQAIQSFLSPESPRIRALGGSRFDTSRNAAEEWKEFGSYYLTLPRSGFTHALIVISKILTRRRLFWWASHVSCLRSVEPKTYGVPATRLA